MVAGVPITVYNRECAGHIITVFIDFTSTGATRAELITLTAGLPYFDLTKNHPIMCVSYISTQNDTVFTDIEDCSDLSDSDMGRGQAPTAIGEFRVVSVNTFEFWTVKDIDGTLILTYWAAGTAAV